MKKLAIPWAALGAELPVPEVVSSLLGFAGPLLDGFTDARWEAGPRGFEAGDDPADDAQVAHELLVFALECLLEHFNLVFDLLGVGPGLLRLLELLGCHSPNALVVVHLVV